MGRTLIQPTVFTSILLSSLLTTSCQASYNEMAKEFTGSAPQETIAEADLAQTSLPAEPSQSPSPKAPPQLIKTAQITLEVESISEILEKASNIVKQQQGDILELQENKPSDDQTRHNAFLRLRVPQNNLDRTLKQFSELGIVQNQSINATDVSSQLVDFEARLRNLRKTEEALLEIMNRSGSVGDVLKVAQELSNVRSQIEQIDAQLKDLRNRVAYSTISLYLEALGTSPSPGQPVSTQLGKTWKQATRSVGEFTIGLGKLGLWLLAYSPFLLIVAAGVWLRFYLKKRHSNPES